MLESTVSPSETLATIATPIFTGIPSQPTAPTTRRIGITFGSSEIMATEKLRNAIQMQAVLVYEQAILGAYVEVMTSLSRINNLRSMFELKEQQVTRLTESIDISNSLFNSARADYLEVLTTRRDALEAQIELIEIRRLQLSASVEVYRALGGGWRPTAEAEAASARETTGETPSGSTEEPADTTAAGEE